MIIILLLCALIGLSAAETPSLRGVHNYNACIDALESENSFAEFENIIVPLLVRCVTNDSLLPELLFSFRDRELGLHPNEIDVNVKQLINDTCGNEDLNIFLNFTKDKFHLWTRKLRHFIDIAKEYHPLPRFTPMISFNAFLHNLILFDSAIRPKRFVDVRDIYSDIFRRRVVRSLILRVNYLDGTNDTGLAKVLQTARHFLQSNRGGVSGDTLEYENILNRINAFDYVTNNIDDEGTSTFAHERPFSFELKYFIFEIRMYVNYYKRSNLRNILTDFNERPNTRRKFRLIYEKINDILNS